MTVLPRLMIAVSFMMSACMPISGEGVSAKYSPPEDSGLVAVRPYPKSDDVCQVIGENDLTADYLDHTKTLVGCPAHEKGAIADRISDGAVRLDQIGDWVLLSI